VEQQESIWPELFPSETLRADKRSAIKDGTLHIFLREMECKLIAPGTAAFITNQVRFYDDDAQAAGGTNIIAIDPVPPPSPREVEKNLHNKNYEAIGVLSRKGGDYYLRHYELMRGHDPGWTLAKIFELSHKYQCVNVSVEAIAYQRVLKWLLEKEMSRRQKWLTIMEDDQVGRMAKFHKIVNTIRPLMNHGKLFVRRSHTEFISHITQYPRIQYDDLLDMVAQGLRQLVSPMLELGADQYITIDESNYPDLEHSRYQRAP
jgi:phage terminase large subunit-like protein